MCKRCFYCNSEISGEGVSLTDDYNNYHFCNGMCEKDFIESTTFDSDGIYTIYTSI